MSPKKSISVVIPNYNGVDLLQKNLPLLYASLDKHVPDYEIIIADDASKDDSVKFLKSQYPEIILVEHQQNQGFSKNINSAIFKARKDLVFLLNTDVELTEDYFENLFKYFDKPDTFGVMGKVIGIQDGEIQDAAKYPTIGTISIRANINYIPKEQTKAWLPTLFLSGGWSLVDRIKLEELGAFDEIYSPFYGEDVDLSLRAWKIGYQCYYEPSSICKHPSSTTIGKIKKSFVKIVAKRNKMLFHLIHLDGLPVLLYLFLLTIKVPFRLIMLDIKYVSAYWQFIGIISEARKSRKQLGHLRKVHGIKISLSDIKQKMLKTIDIVPVDKF